MLYSAPDGVPALAFVKLDVVIFAEVWSFCRSALVSCFSLCCFYVLGYYALCIMCVWVVDFGLVHMSKYQLYMVSLIIQ